MHISPVGTPAHWTDGLFYSVGHVLVALGKGVEVPEKGVSGVVNIIADLKKQNRGF
jgi:hypothetical protein